MSIWVELHCDTLGNGADRCGKSTCYGKNGNQPGAMSRTIRLVPNVISQLTATAKNDGWRFSRGKWTCPACYRDAIDTNT